MAENELSPLDQLMLAATASAYVSETKNSSEIIANNENLLKSPSELNDDEFFLAKIAANDLKVLENPTILVSKKVSNKNDIPSSSGGVNKDPTIKKKINLSLIHSGDTDSSDDESNKDFQNSKYNECGRAIKHLLPEAQQRSEFQATLSQSWKPKRVAPPQSRLTANSVQKPITPLKFGLPAAKPEENALNNPFFGIRISKPLISSIVLQERMSGRTAISMAKVKNFIATIGQAQDWVIAGCVVQKSTVRTSQNDSQYIIWTLSDLQNDLQSVSMFLFKTAYKELWKTCVGTVIGVLNPSILDNREGSRHQAALSVDNHQKVMIFGHAKDYGVCKSKKKDGEPCTAFVNTNRCSFCLYHVKQEYQKCSLRSELQSKFSGGGLTALRNKVLGKNEVFYAGKSYMATPAKKSKKLLDMDNKRLSNLSGTEVVTSTTTSPKRKKGLATSLDVSRAQRMKDLQLLRKLNGSTDVLLGLESKQSFDLETLSSEVSLEESRQTALDVVAKLKAKTQTTSKSESNIHKTNDTEDNLSKDTQENNSPIKKITSDPKDTILSLEPSSSKNNLAVIKNIIPNDFVPKLTNLNPENDKIDFNETPKNNAVVTSIVDKNTKEISENKIAPRVAHDKNVSKSNFVPKLTTPNKENDIFSESPKSKTKIQQNKTTNEIPKNNRDKNIASSPQNIKKTETKPKSDQNSAPLVPEFDIESIVDTSKLKMFKNLTSNPAPKLSQNSVIDLNAPVPNRAKQKALQWIHQNGPINKTNPTGVKKSGIKRFLESTESSESKKSKLEEKAIFTDRFRKIMALTSAHADLLEQHDLDEQEKYFNKLEQREKMEEKMMTTYKVQCKAVKCLNCKYTSFSATDKCKQERHVLKVFDAVKRFFKCGNCGNRTVALEICPLLSCKQCGSSKWERTTMMKEKFAKLGGDLSIRGGEQKFTNSVVSGANINLLMPDD